MKIANTYNNHFAGKTEREITIAMPRGIHCRPAGYITKLNRCSPQDIYVQKENREPEKINSLINLLLLELHRGDKVKLIINDTYPDDKLLNAIINCFSAKSVDECSEIYQNFIGTKKE